MTALLPCIEIETAAHPTAAVIWLHGLGADGNDFAGLVPALDLAGCAPIRFIFPHAPSIPVTVNGGYVMPAWYDIVVNDLARQPDRAGIEQSEKAIRALIEREIDRGVKPEKIVLAGFSQGCVMALHTSVRLPYAIAGVVALSGYLALPELLDGERHSANQHTPIYMGHGDQDPVVAMGQGERARDALAALNYTVEWHRYPMQHSVHPQEVVDISTFLRRVLATAQ